MSAAGGQSDRVVLVTGAASGIGAAVCRRLAAPGLRFLVHTRANKSGLDGTVAAIRAAGGTAEPFLADLSDAGAGKSVVEAALAAHGRLDIVVANAGYALKTPITALDDDAWTLAQASIARSFFETARAPAPHLGASPAGRMVAVSAFGAHVFRTGVAAFPATAAAKAALEVTARNLALELAQTGATVNVVSPGFIEKDPGTHSALSPGQFQGYLTQIPMGRLGTQAEVAAVVGFLCSEEASYVTGQVIHVAGGMV